MHAKKGTLCVRDDMLTRAATSEASYIVHWCNQVVTKDSKNETDNKLLVDWTRRAPRCFDRYLLVP